ASFGLYGSGAGERRWAAVDAVDPDVRVSHHLVEVRREVAHEAGEKLRLVIGGARPCDDVCGADSLNVAPQPTGIVGPRRRCDRAIGKQRKRPWPAEDDDIVPTRGGFHK